MINDVVPSFEAGGSCSGILYAGELVIKILYAAEAQIVSSAMHLYGYDTQAHMCKYAEQLE